MFNIKYSKIKLETSGNRPVKLTDLLPDVSRSDLNNDMSSVLRQRKVDC